MLFASQMLPQHVDVFGFSVDRPLSGITALQSGNRDLNHSPVPTKKSRAWRKATTYQRCICLRAVESTDDTIDFLLLEARCRCCQALLPESMTVVKSSHELSTHMGIRRIRERSRSSRALENSAGAAVVDLFAISTTSSNKIIERSNDGFEPCRASDRFTRPGGRYRVSKR